MHPRALALSNAAVVLLALLLPRVTLAEPSPWRPIVLSELPPGHMAELRISAGVPIVVRFESELDPAGTRLREKGPSPFESLDVSGRLLLLHPSASAWLWPRMHLQVRRMDGTGLTLVLVPSPPALADVQVDVFLHPFSPGALRVALEKVSAEHEALKLQYASSQDELARYRDDEFNVDVAIAVLLLDDEASSHLVKDKALEVKNADVRALAWFVRLAGRSAYVFFVMNRHRTESWTLGQGAILNDRTRESLPVIVRARPSVIPPGGSGRVVLVTRTPPSASKARYEVQLQGPGDPRWQLCYYGAQL
ncbi:MAG TPA: DUF2381 family protein [Archangium sp.]|uniref:DUF2381 family protein n=1 Tax=Archangium sp. TaxID=1872627 RepID=UPI002E3706A7|nr:DUF2381 family protein [Archangium sp.]HEX5751252.1 DUF2381 family protein [Archangium sp.]